MYTPEDDIITNSDEGRRLPDSNSEPLEGVKKEESNLLKAEPKAEKKKGTVDVKPQQKKEMK